MRIRLVIALLLSLCAPIVHAQEAPETKTRIIANPKVTDEGYFWAAVEFRVPKGWHIYWQNPGDSGIPTSIDWRVPYGMSPGAIHWPLPERQPMGDLTNFGYSGRVVLPTPIKLSKDANLKGSLLAEASWLVCKDICIPQSASLEYDLSRDTPIADAQRLKSALYKVPEPFEGEAYIVANKQEVTVALAIPQGSVKADILPIDDGWFKNSALPRVELRQGWQLFHLPRGHADVTERFRGVVVTEAAGKKVSYQFEAARVEALPESIPAATSDSRTILLALVFAFLGGLILNLMPCVLPVLALKALSLAKKSDASRAEALKLGLAYTAGVLVSFAAIGALLLALKAGGAAVGWGFQLQSPGFVLALALVVSLVAFNLIGLFELPVLLGSTGSHIAARHNALGSFATGALAVALATPCSAPFMAPALGVALTLSPAGAMLIFLGLGLGLALPYLLISISPGLRRLLPKPGAWMQRFRELLAFPMFATTAWLLWVLSEQTGGMGLLQGFAVLLLVALALWGLKHNHLRLWRAMWWFVLFAAIAWAALCPPRIGAKSASASALPHEAFTPAKLDALRAEGKPVFVDATAAWCITCKVNERTALSSASVMALFKERDIAFLVADWTKRDADITAWLASFGRSGVPLYVYYPAEGAPRVLPQLLTPSIVETAIQGPN